MRYSDYVSTKKTPQSEPIFGTTNQVENNAGGFVYKVSKWDQLLRFLILGSAGGTYYVGERKLTIENAQVVIDCLAEDAAKTVEIIAGVSSKGRAPKNDSAIFALALACCNTVQANKIYAYRALPQVLRTGTHLFQFVADIQNLRGWSRGLRSAVSRWYTQNPNVEYQLAKYQNRHGWTHKDVMRLSHPTPKNDTQADLFKLVVGKGQPTENTPIFAAMQALKVAETSHAVAAEIVKGNRLSREMVPTEYQNKPFMQDALLHSMPIGALIRNLGAYSASGFLSSPLTPQVQYVCDMLRNVDVLQKGRVHPYSVLEAMVTYSAGRGVKGKLTWTPVQAIVDALNDAFYLAFQSVEATNKRHLLAIDVSGSMTCAAIGGGNLSAAAAAAAMALVTANVEKNAEIVGFSTKSNHSNPADNLIVPLAISPRNRIDDAMLTIAKVPFGRTDCSLPIMYAMQKRLIVDAFVIYTDNETYAGPIHVSQALAEYRSKFNPNAKLVVVGMTATDFSVADENDSGCLNIVGFDTSAPAVITEFVK